MNFPASSQFQFSNTQQSAATTATQRPASVISWQHSSKLSLPSLNLGSGSSRSRLGGGGGGGGEDGGGIARQPPQTPRTTSLLRDVHSPHAHAHAQGSQVTVPSRSRMRSSLSSLNSNPFITSPLSASTSSSSSSHKQTNAHSTPTSTSSSDSYDGVFATVFPTLVQSVARKLTPTTLTISGAARKRGGLTRSSSSPSTEFSATTTSVSASTSASTSSSVRVQQNHHSGAGTSQKRTLKRVASMHSMDVDDEENNSDGSWLARQGDMNIDSGTVVAKPSSKANSSTVHPPSSSYSLSDGGSESHVDTDTPMEVDRDDEIGGLDARGLAVGAAGQRQGKSKEDTLSSIDLSQTFQPPTTSTPHTRFFSGSDNDESKHAIDKSPTTPSVWSQTQSQPRSRSQLQPRTESSSHPSSQSTALTFNNSIVDSQCANQPRARTAQPPSQPRTSQGQMRLSQPFRPPLPSNHVTNAGRGAPRLGMRPTTAAPVRRGGFNSNTIGGFKVPLLPDKARKARLEEIQKVLDSDASSLSQGSSSSSSSTGLSSAGSSLPSSPESCPSASIATSPTVFNSKSKPNTDLNRAKSSTRSEQLEDMDEMEEGNSSFGDISFELEWNEEVENMLRKQGV
ncbi:hypothetical protein BDN71DRAFT_1458432 [Pleurotus eryngii]|uniref:Uncharacterized protein n=1 Tax=Pleurotus eryngii TaxID=5323 RepID=A0A9P5ZHZ8_PLEER|nr:hypothetical protein BDN71DRAFT_1458432 [Pleurotus eryngii]